MLNKVAASVAAETACHQNLFRGKNIPVTYTANYDTLIEATYKSKDEPIYIKASCLNRDCGASESLRLKPWLVNRNAVLLTCAGVAVFENRPVPLAVCDQCKRRFRVLPIEILPYKTFSLPVIEKSCNLYCSSNHGLRKTVQQIPGVAPHFTTLHGWLGGIGERSMDKIKLRTDKAVTGEPSLPSTAAVVAETNKKQDAHLIHRWNKTDPSIAFWKYQTLHRKELLKACFKLLLMAACLFQKNDSPLTAWEESLLLLFYVPCWLFPSRPIVTPIQLADFKEDMVLHSSNETSKRGPP